MLESLLYLLAALAALGFLIFVHELGHYYMARHVGIRVEAFGIGFGRPVYKWMHDGVEWRLNWIPFGGYVKMKGADDDESVDPYTVADGFFGKPPIDRIKVSLAGPLANLLLALAVFGVLWLMGGRDKSYAEFSNKVGWVDPKSELYQMGVRPGDQISAYGDHLFTNAKDHLYEPLVARGQLRVRGEHFDYLQGTHAPFDVSAPVYTNPRFGDKGLKTAGILEPASFLIYEPQKYEAGKVDELVHLMATYSPLTESGIRPNDRLIWANGELIFSQGQLSYLLNESRALVTVQRGGKTFLRRIPRTQFAELRLSPAVREEIVDWQHEAGLQGVKTAKLTLIPYNITHDGIVEETLTFIDPEHQKAAFPAVLYSSAEESLKVGDKIIAVNGIPVTTAHDILLQVQEPRVVMIVMRDGTEEIHNMLWTQANQDYFRDVKWNQLETVIDGVGVSNSPEMSGNFYRLKPVTPKVHSAFSTSPELQALYTNEVRTLQKHIDEMEDPERRSQAIESLKQAQGLLHLGPPYFVDRTVVFNPSPLALFNNVLDEIWRTLSALVSGTLSPKFIAGPVGLVQMIQENWSVGIKEGLFWLGAVSLNLGILNLLPIPVLDGGSICFSLFELVTRRQIKIKTLEKLVIPFAILLVVFFVYLTYNDVSRIVSRILGG